MGERAETPAKRSSGGGFAGRLIRFCKWLQLEFLGLGLLGSIAATFPLVFHPLSRLPGCELVGPYSHVWKLWWTYDALLHKGCNPAHTTLLSYPEGLDVGYYMANFINGMWTLPITHWFGPVASYNAVCLLTPATGCWAAAVLGRAVGLPRWPAAFAGLTWSLAPHYLGFMMGGGIENLGTPWFPLFVLAAIRLLGLPVSEDRPSWRGRLGWSALLAFCLWLVSMTSWFNGLALAMFVGWFVVVAVFFRRLKVFGGLAWLVPALGIGSVAVVVSAKLLLPAPEILPPPFFHLQSDNLGFLAMGWKQQVPDSILYSATTLWLNHHLLVVVSALALLGGLTVGGRVWLLLALPLLVDFVVPDAWVRWTDTAIPSSLAPVYSVVARLFQEPQRRLYPLHLLLSLSAGHGLALAGQRLRMANWIAVSRALPVAAFAVWALELVIAGPVRMPLALFEVRQSFHVKYLAENRAGAVLDIPIVVGPQMGSENDIKAVHSRYLLYQTRHGHPILAAVGTQLPDTIHDLPLSDPLVALVVNRCCWPSAWTPPPARWDPRNLREAGYRWIVVHRDLLPTPTSLQLEPELRMLLGKPARSGKDVLVFRVPEGPRSLDADRDAFPNLDIRKLMDITYAMETLKPHEFASSCTINYLLQRLTDSRSVAEAWTRSALREDHRAAARTGAPGRQQLEVFSDSMLTVLRQRRHLMSKKSHRMTGLMTAQTLYRIWQLLDDRERARDMERELVAQIEWVGFRPQLEDLPFHPTGLRLPPCFWPVEIGPAGPGQPLDAEGVPGAQLPCWDTTDMTWLDDTFETSYWSSEGGGKTRVKEKLPR